MDGPLDGIRVIELAGIGPGPHAAMILSDLGAEVIRVQRPGPQAPSTEVHTLRGRTVITRDLKRPEDRDDVLELLSTADVLLEGLRPGVLERLGLSPEVVTSRNPRIVYARITGWGQDGPWAHMAGHDINYISVTGALHAIGSEERPIPPLNLIGDYAGGSMLAVQGILAALLQRERTGRGQVVDAAMIDGASVLIQAVLELRDTGQWTDRRAGNILDGAAPFYRTYACSDGAFMAVGAMERQFFALFVEGLGFDVAELPDRDDPANWPALSNLFSTRFAEHPRGHWEKVFAGTDACVTPVLTFAEAVTHPQVAARGSVRAGAGTSVVAGRAPRFLPTSAGSPATAEAAQPGQEH